MSWIKFIFIYSYSDLFTEHNRTGSIINIIQISLLIFVITILITFSGSFNQHLKYALEDGCKIIAISYTKNWYHITTESDYMFIKKNIDDIKKELDIKINFSQVF